MFSTPLEFWVISLEKEPLRARNHIEWRETGAEGEVPMTKEGKCQSKPVKILKWTESSQSVPSVGAGDYLAELLPSSDSRWALQLWKLVELTDGYEQDLSW